MKLKDVFLVVCIGALIVSEFFLFSANEKKNAALVQAQAAQHEAKQAREDLEQFKTTVASQIAEDSKLRTDNQILSQKLTKLQDANNRLTASNRQLTQQVAGANEAAAQQQAQLEQIQMENQAAADRNTCIANLRQLAVAKAAWALENNKPASAIPTQTDLLPYFPTGTFPTCPSGGSYTINAVGDSPTCSIPGHVLPPQQ